MSGHLNKDPARTVSAHEELCGSLVMVVEFTGIARSYNLTKLIASLLPAADILEIDPLSVPENALWSVSARAQEFCRKIVGRAPARVVIIGYCSAAVLCGQVARQLTQSGINVTGTALLDPVIVDDELIDNALQEIESSLDCGSRIRDNIPAVSNELFDISRTEELLRVLANEYGATHFPGGARIESLIEELADRYIAWISFLCSTAWDTVPMRHPGRLAIFSSVDALASGEYRTIFEVDELKLYPSHGQPCISLPDCVADLCAWMKEVIACK